MDPLKPPGVGWWRAAAAILLFGLAYFSFNSDVGSDPRLTLLVSQAILDYGTVRLDAYQNEELLGQPFHAYLLEGNIIEANGHYYTYFPVGPSVLSLPFVAAARLLGQDMRTADNYRLQSLLSALTCVACFWLLLAVARYYLDRRASLMFALLTVLGSGLISTLGTALWSSNYAVLIILTVLWLLVRAEHGQPLPAFWLGILLFLAFFCRAATVAFIAPMLLYLLLRYRRAFWPTAATALVGLLLFLLWSRQTSGSWLPAYYAVARVQAERPPLRLGVWGNLVSPSRGLFVFYPYLIIVSGSLLALGRHLRRQPLIWMCLAWFGLHLWLVARAASWWGGWSFGPRLLVDAFPAWIIVTLLVWSAAQRAWSVTWQRRILAAYLGLSAAAVLIHTGQGLYSQPASRWNARIQPIPVRPEQGPGDLFNWRYAQFLATNRMLCAIEADKAAAYVPEDKTLQPYSWGRMMTEMADQAQRVSPYLFLPAPMKQAELPVTPTPGSFKPQVGALLPLVARSGNDALFVGWSQPGGGFRWSECRQARILFRLKNVPDPPQPIRLWLAAGSLGPQTVSVLINGTLVGRLELAAIERMPPRVPLTFDSALLRPDSVNEIGFVLPDAHMPVPYFADYHWQVDQRQLGLAFMALWLEPASPE